MPNYEKIVETLKKYDIYIDFSKTDKKDLELLKEVFDEKGR